MLFLSRYSIKAGLSMLPTVTIASKQNELFNYLRFSILKYTIVLRNCSNRYSIANVYSTFIYCNKDIFEEGTIWLSESSLK